MLTRGCPESNWNCCTHKNLGLGRVDYSCACTNGMLGVPLSPIGPCFMVPEINLNLCLTEACLLGNFWSDKVSAAQVLGVLLSKEPQLCH